MKKIYLFYTCNAWKEHSSMRLVVATTSLQKLKSIIIKKIKDGDVAYIEEEWSITKQLKEFREDWKNCNIEEVLERMEYGCIDIVNDGEEQ